MFALGLNLYGISMRLTPFNFKFLIKPKRYVCPWIKFVWNFNEVTAFQEYNVIVAGNEQDTG